MEIRKVSIIGLGALGTLFGHHLSKRMPKGDIKIIADQDRIARYVRDKVYCNGEVCDFQYVTPEEKCEPADLVMIAVKYHQLRAAISAVKNQIGPHTLILSLLNGITSEEIISAVYGADKVVYCVAQGMDAVKEGNKLTYEHMGMLCIGEFDQDTHSERVASIAAFFQKTGLPHEIDMHMKKRLWGKFMLNVGVNQTIAVYGTKYNSVQQAGPARDTMISAMREVISLSEKEGIGLAEDDLRYWLALLGTLDPEGKPSMRQDVEARRLSEVDLFAGAVQALSKKHGLSTPVNHMLYEKIKALEAQY